MQATLLLKKIIDTPFLLCPEDTISQQSSYFPASLPLYTDVCAHTNTSICGTDDQKEGV